LNIFERFQKQLEPVFYVQIWGIRIRAVDILTGDTFDKKSIVALETNKKRQVVIKAVGSEASFMSGDAISIINPFKHERTLLADFTLAERLLRYIFQKLYEGKRFRASPIVVIHPMEKLEGGLTMIEDRAFRELALMAGARETVLYLGEQLLIHDFDLEKVKALDIKK
jgi:rod shape-determining protein MreB